MSITTKTRDKNGTTFYSPVRSPGEQLRVGRRPWRDKKKGAAAGKRKATPSWEAPLLRPREKMTSMLLQPHTRGRHKCNKRRTKAKQKQEEEEEEGEEEERRRRRRRREGRGLQGLQLSVPLMIDNSQFQDKHGHIAGAHMGVIGPPQPTMCKWG